ncbi:MAG: ATP-binding protein [Cyanobacteria bacterium P01_A01_bin.114]
MSAAHTLLIVDDCAEDREVYREYLADDPDYAYQFIEAPRAETGLELFRQHRCDAVLLDFSMPDMDGFEFLSELERRQLKVRPPIIMLTGQGNEAIAVEAMKQGVQDYLGKQHLQPEALQLAVRNVIQRSHARATLRETRERQRLTATTALRIRQSLDVDEILGTAVAEVLLLLGCDHVAVCRRISNQPIEIRAELGTRNAPIVLGESSSLSKSSLGSIAGNRRDLIAPVALASSKLAASKMNHPWGYLIAHRAVKKRVWQPEDYAILNELAMHLAIAIQQAEQLAQTQTALKKAQDINAFKSQVITTISHEYRSPLAAILGAASTLIRHGDRLDKPKQARFLDMIQQKARQMTKRVDDMLIVHQCEFDPIKLEPLPLNLLQLLADMVEERRETAGENYELVFQISGKTSGFWGDQSLLRLAINNLLSNAIKYSPDGGVIEVVLKGEEQTGLICIQDQGIGVPKTDQPNLFQPFSRASNVESIPGSGLGLAIAKACIELHCGDILLESQEGEGTRVFARLPKQPTVPNYSYPTGV